MGKKKLGKEITDCIYSLEKLGVPDDELEKLTKAIEKRLNPPSGVTKKEAFDFIARFNELTGKRHQPNRPDSKFKRELSARLKEGWTLDQIFQAVEAASADPFHKEHKKAYLTPEYICRSNQLQKWHAVFMANNKKQNKKAPTPLTERFKLNG